MDAQRLKAHAQTIKAMQAVADEMVNYMPGAPERDILQKAYDELRDVSWKLIADDVADWVDTINNSSKGLSDLSQEMEKTSESLKQIADVVKAVAKTIGVLADIVVLAAGVGLL